jgi:methylmalonyl-CoA/ethylmalonyl-CoA epimerase
MIGRLNHVAIAVRDIAKAARLYRETLGADVSAAVAQPDHGVTTAFVTLPNTKIELLEPRDCLKAAGARVLGDGQPRTGAHGKPVLFLHPKDFCGTLVEIEQA